VAKLVATYAAGMFAVFTEDRTGMRQRALIDIGDEDPYAKRHGGIGRGTVRSMGMGQSD
jgi:hypothetical protein